MNYVPVILVILLMSHGACTAQTVSELKRQEQADEPLFFKAIRKQDIGQLQKLFAAGADITVRNTKGQTPLHVAAEEGNLDAVEMLLSHEANPNAMDAAGLTPLSLAVLNSSYPIVAMLLAAGADPALKNPLTFQIPLHDTVYAISRDKDTSISIAKMLVKAGSPINAEDLRGRTPLYLAVIRREPSMVSTLMELGADPRHAGPGQPSPLEYAEKFARAAPSTGYQEIVKILARKK